MLNADLELEAYLQHREYMIRGKIYTLLLMSLSLSLEGFTSHFFDKSVCERRYVHAKNGDVASNMADCD